MDTAKSIKGLKEPAEFADPSLLGGAAMSSTYQTQRSQFNKLARNYLEYLNLYKQFNNGSIVGATPFSEFYWRVVYYSRYSDVRRVGPNGL